MTLPDLHPGIAGNRDVIAELRLLRDGVGAFKVALPFNGPDSAAGKYAWLPRSQVTMGSAAGGFNCFRFTMPVWLHRRLARELA